MIKSWYLEHKGKVCIMEKTLGMEMSTDLNYALIKKIFKSANLSREEQQAIFQIVFQGHQTDSIIRVQTECELSIPHPAIKAYLWSHVSDPERARNMSQYDFCMMLRALSQPFFMYHYDMVFPYQELFFDIAPMIVMKLDRMRAKSFLKYLRPSIRGQKEDQERLQKMLDDVIQDAEHPLREHSFYLDFLKEQINYIDTLIKVREASNL